MNPDAIQPMKEKIVGVIMTPTKAAMVIRPNTPAKIVRSREPANPNNFMKHFETFFSISNHLSVVKLDYVYSLIPMVCRVLVKAEP